MEEQKTQFSHVKQIIVIGTGLLGGSIGLGLKAAGFTGKIIGVGHRPETLERAKSRGCVDIVDTTTRPYMRETQLVILASPIATFTEWLLRLGPDCHPGIVITDVGSTKTDVCATAVKWLSGNVKRFVGAHPMAGSEMHGPEAATADLFRGKPCVLTPMGDADPDAVATVEALWTKLGMRLVRMLPRDHDWTVAHVSHLPHAVAAALVLHAISIEGLSIASTGFRDSTRVASGDPHIWAGIFTTNRAAIIEAIGQFVQELTAFRDVLAKEDDAHLLELLRRAQRSRNDWLKSFGETPSERQGRRSSTPSETPETSASPESPESPESENPLESPNA